MRIISLILLLSAYTFSIPLGGAKSTQTITINHLSVQETTGHFLYQRKIPRVGMVAEHTGAAGDIGITRVNDTTRIPRWVIYKADTIYLYADIAVSTATDTSYLLHYGTALNETNASATFTNCGVNMFLGLDATGSTSSDYAGGVVFTVNSPAALGSTGVFDGALAVSTTGHALASSQIISNVQKYSISVVFNLQASLSGYSIMSRIGTAGATSGQITMHPTTANISFTDAIYGGFNPTALGITTNQNNLFTMVFDGTQTGNANRFKLYLNGNPVTLNFTGTVGSTSNTVSSSVVYVGYTSTSTNSIIDNYNISLAATTAGYEQTKYNMLFSPSTFSTFGALSTTALDTLQKASSVAGVTLGSLISRSVSAAVDYKYINFIDTTFDKVTVGLNMVNTWTARNTYNWNWTDSSIACVKLMTRKKKIHVNTLVWSNYVPTWISGGGYSADTIKVLLNEYITATMQHIRTTAGSDYTIEYDVVNEDLNTTNFWKTNVSDYMDYCFRAARVADPAAILYYNEYAMETTGDRLNKANRFIASLTALKALNTPIDYIGLQSHFAADTGSVLRMSGVIKQINRIKALGYNVAITELDWRMPLPITDTAATYEDQRRRVGSYIEQVLATGVKDITFWGFDDSTSASVTAGYGAPTMCKKWDGTKFTKKPFYYAVLSALTASNILAREKNVINIRVNKNAVASVVDSFPLVYDLRNAGTSFWSACKADGSDIYITDSAGNVKNSYLSGFSKTKKLGLLHFVNKVDTVGNRLLKIKYGDQTHTTTNSALALTNAGVVNCFDMSKIDTIRDMAGNQNLVVSNGAQMSVIDTAPLGSGIRSFNSYAYNPSASYALSNLTTGTLEVQYYGDSASANAGYIFGISTTDATSNRIGIYQANVSNKATQYTYITQASSTTYLSTYDSSTFDSSWHTTFVAWGGTACYPYVDNRSEKGRLADRTIPFTGNAYYQLFTNPARQSAAYYKGVISYVAVHSFPRDDKYRSTRQNLLDNNNGFWITTQPLAPVTGSRWDAYKRAFKSAYKSVWK